MARPGFARRYPVYRDYWAGSTLAQPRTGAIRVPHYCSGCPHNTSTRVPEGSRALAGIGCHYMALWQIETHNSAVTRSIGVALAPGRRLSSFAIVSLESVASRPPCSSSASAASTPAPPPLVTRWDTAFGAVLTQCLTGAVLVAAAATLYAGSASAGLSSVGEISNALTPLLGESVGRLVFSAVAQSGRRLLLQARPLGAAPYPRRIQRGTQGPYHGRHGSLQSRPRRPHMVL